MALSYNKSKNIIEENSFFHLKKKRKERIPEGNLKIYSHKKKNKEKIVLEGELRK